MKISVLFFSARIQAYTPSWKISCLIFAVTTASFISGCNRSENHTVQTIVRVNGEEITQLQLNDEMEQANIVPANIDIARKKILENLIDRQLVSEAAKSEKLHRTPKVIQSIENAKAQILEQAYFENITANLPPPSKSEISEYFRAHPEYFTERKMFNIQQLAIPAESMNSELKKLINASPALDQLVLWMSRRNIKFNRSVISGTTSDLPEKISGQLNKMQKGQIFMMNEGGVSMINYIVDISPSPVGLEEATEQIEQYLSRKKNIQEIEHEVARLRSGAKIEYLSTLTR